MEPSGRGKRAALEFRAERATRVLDQTKVLLAIVAVKVALLATVLRH